MSIDGRKEFEEYIDRIIRCGAGTYGTDLFMLQKDEQWKFLWAWEHIKELESHNSVLMERDEKYCNTITGLQQENIALQERIEKLETALDHIRIIHNNMTLLVGVIEELGNA